MSTSARRFDGAHALITGAGSGIGEALARRLADEGAARLTLADVNAAALDELAAALADTGVTVDAQVVDVSNRNDVDRLTATLNDAPPLDAAAINAGIAGVGGPIVDLSLENWRAVTAVNLDGAFLTLKAALGAIRDGGAIVTTASITAIKPVPGIAAYAASKAALIQLTRVAAVEAAPRKVRVNAVAPAGVATNIWNDQPFFDHLVAQAGSREAALAQIGAGTPLGDIAEAGDTAAQIAFLLSRDAATITGATLVADAGWSL